MGLIGKASFLTQFDIISKSISCLLDKVILPFPDNTMRIKPILYKKNPILSVYDQVYINPTWCRYHSLILEAKL